MTTGYSYHRVLLLSPNNEPLRAAFADSALADWEPVGADSSAAAALLLQTNPCDLLLADEAHYRREGIDGLAWLAKKETVPILFLADLGPLAVAEAYERGVSLWLPQRQTLDHPNLLAGALERALRWSDLQRTHARTRDALDQSQRQVDRLVGLMWRTAPMHVDRRWYTHRHMLERLEEELARADRHQLPLTVALGEVEMPHDPDGPARELEMLNWTADEVSRRKRRSDVAGQYGMQGFMVLMAHTPAEGGMVCCRRLHAHLEEGPAAGTTPREPVRAYFGLASYSGKAGANTQSLLRQAEERLDAAKRQQGRRVVAE